MTKENLHQPTDNTSNLVGHTPREIHLKSIDQVRLEMAKVYRDMRLGKMPTHDGTRLVYVLAQIGKMIELYDIERRLSLLEQEK